MNALAAPLALLAELTHRCPLRCPYCSNPLKLTPASGELRTDDWGRVFGEAAALGCMQVHLSGGEPAVRRDLDALVAAAAEAGLYTNLITSGVLLDAARLQALRDRGLEHVQLSFQDSTPEIADVVAGLEGAHAKKLAVARDIREAGLALTTNFVVHRRNIQHVEAMLDLGMSLGAERIEIASVQYHGWAIPNRASLMPTRAQLADATRVVEAARRTLEGIVIDFVVTDYYAQRPKACMGGWGRQFLVVSPAGFVLPCHAAETIPDLKFDNVRERALADIWRHSHAFNLFRGTAWMKEPCRSCERAEIDWGGCRCQALAVGGDPALADPACALSPAHGALLAMADADSTGNQRRFIYRQLRAGKSGEQSVAIEDAEAPA